MAHSSQSLILRLVWLLLAKAVSQPPAKKREAITKSCQFCEEDIPLSAVVCRQCRSFQGWRWWVRIVGINLTGASILASLGVFLIQQWQLKRTASVLNIGVIASHDIGNNYGNLAFDVSNDSFSKVLQFDKKVRMKCVRLNAVQIQGNKTTIYDPSGGSDLEMIDEDNALRPRIQKVLHYKFSSLTPYDIDRIGKALNDGTGVCSVNIFADTVPRRTRQYYWERDFAVFFKIDRHSFEAIVHNRQQAPNGEETRALASDPTDFMHWSMTGDQERSED